MKLQHHIAQRFDALSGSYRKELARARKRGSENAVHDLRVASRRVLEMLRVFEGTLDGDVVRPVRRSLKRWMKASGGVRDLDIAISLAKECGNADAMQCGLIWKKKREVRWKRVLPEIHEASVWKGNTAGETLVPDWVASGQSAIWDSSLSAAENASLALPLLLDRYLLHGNALHAGTDGIEREDGAYHRFRLRTKRFRYTVEAFDGFYAKAPYLALLGKLKRFQEILGALHDCEVASALLRGIRQKNSKVEDPETVADAASEVVQGEGFEVFLEAKARDLKGKWHEEWAEFSDVEVGNAVRTLLRDGAADLEPVAQKRSAKQEALGASAASSRKAS